MSAVAHSMDAISLGFSDEDYKAERPELKTDTFFEWRISDANIKRTKKGDNLTVVLKCEALDANAAAMAPKWMNVAMPVSIPGENITCPDYAKKMFLAQMAPLFPELGPYDNVEVDPYSGTKTYYKDGEVITGKAFDLARFDSNKRIGALAKEFAQVWMETMDKSSLDVLLDKRFFAILKKSKDGQYVNIAEMRASAPTDKDVVYDRKEAFKKK